MTLWKKFKQLFSASEAEVSDLPELEQLLGYHFNNPKLALLALTHRSLVRVNNGDLPSNERLEFLGDSVLGLVIADQLYRDHPDQAEGNLTKLKAMLVNEIALARVGIECGFNTHIQMSVDEDRSGGRERPSIVSDTLEALIGAVYIDGGLEAARRMILNCLYSRRDNIVNDVAQQNYKGDLLERIQAISTELPCYEVVRESGPDHDKTFEVVIKVGQRILGEGAGPSKKDAEQKAAHMALDYLNEHQPE